MAKNPVIVTRLPSLRVRCYLFQGYSLGVWHFVIWAGSSDTYVHAPMPVQAAATAGVPLIVWTRFEVDPECETPVVVHWLPQARELVAVPLQLSSALVPFSPWVAIVTS